MSDADRHRLRATFGEDAELYERARPEYPAELFADLVALALLGPGSSVLEIGCGTGQATVALARLGCAVTAVELGGALAGIARRKLTGFDARVVVTPFEDWQLPPEPFDLVVAATSFHWVDPAVRVRKSADALRPGGSLAVVSTHHVAGGTNAFFADAQRCYERFDPATPPGLQLQAADDLPCDSAEFDQSGRFGPVLFRRYVADHTYTSDGYLNLLSTFSGHRALPSPARQGLFSCLRHLIDNNHQGVITKRLMTQLAIAHRAR